MPKMVCSKCEVELRPSLKGVNVLETQGKTTPYQIWSADEWECPKCGIKVVAGFSDLCIPHWEAMFEDTLNRITSNELRSLLRYDRES